MDRGLDELIEWLLTEIAFSGLEGFSAEDLVRAVKTFYAVDNVNAASHSGSHADLPSRDAIDAQQIGPDDVAHASVVWRWLLSSKDVAIDIRYQNMSLEDVLASEGDKPVSIPIVDATSSTGTPAEANGAPPAKKRKLGSIGETESAKGRRARETISQAKACLHLSDERLWKTIAGHGPDLKRVPQFEWRALVAIASARERGILQGDLVRLTGQDKRSLPMRTEALARKGYIIKQPYMLRGCRTSKLWLSQFAEKAQELCQRVGLPLEEIDLSKEALSKNFDPLPFSNYWTGEHIDYVALGQAFIAVARAWGLSRYSDLRKQLDVEEKVPQMRALAKSSRWFANVGVIEFTPAKFENNYRVFKDCVHFLRDPTSSEWKRFRTTPKAHMTAPSTRRKGRGAESGPSTPQARSKVSREDPVKLRARRAFWKSLPSPDMIKLSSWTPYKPMTNTIFEIIKRSGNQGISNPDIGTFTVGWQFRKYIASLTSLLSQSRDLPANLQTFKITSQFNRLGRANIYQFFALPDSENQDVSIFEATVKELEQGAEENQRENSPLINTADRFSQLSASQFSERPADVLTQIGPRYTTRPGPKSKRRLSIGSETSATPYRQVKRARQGDSSFETATEEVQVQQNLARRNTDTPTRRRVNEDIDEDEHGTPERRTSYTAAPLRPEVYRGQPHSIGPVRRARGRQRRSLVLIFRSVALTNPDFLSQKSSAATLGVNPFHASLLTTEPDNDVLPSHGEVSASSTYDGPDHRSKPRHDATDMNTTASPTHDEKEQDNDLIPMIPTASIESKSSKKRNGRKSTGPRLWVCEKCGNSWKNNNGLEYHQTKSQTICNPEYVAPPIVPKIEKAPKMKPVKPVEVKVDTRDLLPSKRPSLAGRPAVPTNQPSNTSTLSEASQSTLDQGAVILNSVSLHNVPDSILPPTTSRASSVIAGRLASSLQKATPMPKLQAIKSQSQGAQYSKLTEPAVPVISKQARNRLPFIDQATSQKLVGTPGSTQPLIINDDTSATVEATESSADNNPSGALQTSTIDVVPGVGKIAPIDLSILLPPEKKVRSASLDHTIGIANIIQDLLVRNNGALPGDRSLYLMIESMWSRRSKNSDTPDWKTCQEVLTKMAKTGFIKEEYFGFINQKGRTTTCSVISRFYSEDDRNEALVTTIAKKVAEVKDKSKELHPSPYIPPWFPLYLKELDSATEISERTIDDTSSHQSPRPRQKTKAQVLIMDYKPPGDKSAKSQRSSASGPVSELSKRRSRKDTDLGGLPGLSSQKQQNRPPIVTHDGRAKRAPFVCGQQQTDARWLPGPTYLQNPSSGTWSWIPPAPLRAEVELDRIRRRVYRDLIAAARLDRDLTDAALEDLMPDVQNAMAASMSVQILEPSTSASFRGDGDELDEEEDDDENITQSLSHEDADTVHEADDEPIVTGDTLSPFTPITRIELDSAGVWPTKFPRQFFEDKFGGSFTMVGHFPSLSWFLRQNLPQSAMEIIDSNDRNSAAPDTAYGKFIRDVSKIGAWELSPEGIYLQYRGSIAPEYIFISLTGVQSGDNMRPVQLEWQDDLQYTFRKIPAEIVYAISDDENITTLALTAGDKVDNLERLLKDDRPSRKRRKRKTAPRPVRIPGLRRETLYKTRFLLDVPKSNSRWSKFNKHKTVGDDLGLEGQHELVVAFVVIKTLVGGVDKVIDWGRIMKLFPHMSLSGLRRTWAQFSKERRNFMTAFCDKFQAAFLEAYEKGEVPPLDYDDLDSYDWKGIVRWASKLETHEKLKLPVTRKKFDNDNSLEDIEDPDQDWRDSWFHPQASVFIRMDAAAGEPMTVPHITPSKTDPDGDELKVARSWIRALCNNNEREPVGQEVRDRLLKLGSKRDKASLNAILGRAVDGLFSDKVICKVKNTKATRQVYKLNNNFTNRANKLSNIDKFIQAAAFKTELDESLGSRGEAIVPFAADSGTIIAVINLQASGRIKTEAIDYPELPFGFEPGNYEGRQFPKHYYHFQVKVLPTDKYIYNEDLPVLEAAASQPIPDKSSIGEIPLWFDFFENLDRARWVQCLCSVVFATATKGPTNVEGLVGLLRPCLEPFEVVLIYDWLDRLGLMTSVTGSQGWSVGEWWWLVVGRQAQRNEKGKGRAITST